LSRGRIEEEPNRRFSEGGAIGIGRRVVRIRRVVVLHAIERRLEECRCVLDGYMNGKSRRSFNFSGATDGSRLKGSDTGGTARRKQEGYDPGKVESY
jgi:hypothetical protein